MAATGHCVMPLMEQPIMPTLPFDQGCRVIHSMVSAPSAGVLVVDGPHGALELRYERLVLATGARERFLPFPGWTSPRVLGAGGLQAMVKSGMPAGGKRV